MFFNLNLNFYILCFAIFSRFLLFFHLYIIYKKLYFNLEMVSLQQQLFYFIYIFISFFLYLNFYISSQTLKVFFLLIIIFLHVYCKIDCKISSKLGEIISKNSIKSVLIYKAVNEFDNQSLIISHIIKSIILLCFP